MKFDKYFKTKPTKKLKLSIFCTEIPSKKMKNKQANKKIKKTHQIMYLIPRNSIFSTTVKLNQIYQIKVIKVYSKMIRAKA